ncbi:MAG: hypothetical protein P3B76_04450 [Gemmatimonadota bacterium]|jgi:type IV pilus assembly protein PilV|nr:hypothetical protein [Gemmatimonadota bacterium]MDQ8167720.1 hypothetical protein [Gemmatimonadota bacterium]MDQ8171915.1 hypothetical protein [Gemmatimonadota bacterium]
MTRPQRGGTPTPRRGISLVEILVAIVMITVAVGGLVGSAAAVATEMGGGVRQTVAAAVAQARLDSLTSLSCNQLAGGAATGSSTTRGVRESWTVTDGRNVKTIAVQINILRRSNPLLYTMVIPCRD